jgi:hypothetical protein
MLWEFCPEFIQAKTWQQYSTISREISLKITRLVLNIWLANIHAMQNFPLQSQCQCDNSQI